MVRKVSVRLNESTVSVLEQLVKMEYVKFRDNLFRIGSISDAIRFCIMVALNTLAEEMWEDARALLQEDLKPKLRYGRQTDKEKTV